MTLKRLFTEKANDLACKIAHAKGFTLVKAENGAEPYIQLLEKGVQHTVIGLGQVRRSAKNGAKVSLAEFTKLVDNPNGLPAKMAMFARMALMQAMPAPQPILQPIPVKTVNMKTGS